MAITVPIITEFNPKGIKAAIAEFKSLEGAGAKTGFAMQKAFLPAVAVLGGIVAGLGMATKAAIEDKEAQEQLAGVLERSTGATEKQVAATEEWITTLSKATATADDELRPALASLATATGDLGKAQEILVAAQDIAVSTGADLSTTVDALSAAYNGNMKGLKALDPSLTANIKSGASFDAVMQSLARTTGGAASDAANTTAGRMKGLKISFDEAKEAIGSALIPAVDKLIAILVPMAKWAEGNTSLFLGLAGGIGTLAAGVIALNIVIKVWKAIAVATTIINYALATSYTAVQVASGAIIATGVLAAVAGGVYVIRKTQLLGIEVNDAYIRSLQALGNQHSITMGIIGDKGRSTGAGSLVVTDAQVMRTQMLRWAGLAASFEDTKKSGAGAATVVASLAEALKTKLGSALETAKAALETAQTAFDNFATKVATGLKSAFSFADAETAGGETGGGFLAGLRAQIGDIKRYTDKVQQLLGLGLSQDALASVLDAGQVAGGKIADQLIAGGVTAIDETNALVASMNMAADKVGLGAAGKWYQSGVDQATKIVDGLQAAIDRLTPKIMAQMDALAAKMHRKVSIDVNVTERVNRILTNIGGDVTKLAAGGIVTRPTLAVVGEAGPEAVIPLGKAGGMGAVTINVNGGISSSADIGRAVYNSLLQYRQVYGPLGQLV